MINIEFTGIRFGPNIEGLKYFENPDLTVKEIYIPKSVDSERYSYNGPNPLVFFRESTDAEGNTIRTPVTSVTIPEGARKLILFFFSQKDARGEKIHIVPFEDSGDEFPAGMFRVWNISGFDVAVQIATEKAMVPNGENVSLRPSLDDQEYYPAKMFHKLEGSEEWKQFVNNGWTNRAKQRVMIILLPGQGKDRSPKMFVRANRPS